MASSFKKFISYLWGKRSELGGLSEKDGLLAKLVLDIHRKRSQTSFEVIKLAQLNPIHPINRDNAIAAAKKRTAVLEDSKAVLLKKRVLSCETLQRYIPSVSAIKVVQISESEYVCFEGNGRLYSLQEVFEKSDTMEVEVEKYHFNNMKKMTRRVNRVRRLHGFI